MRLSCPILLSVGLLGCATPQLGKPYPTAAVTAPSATPGPRLQAAPAGPSIAQLETQAREITDAFKKARYNDAKMAALPAQIGIDAPGLAALTEALVPEPQCIEETATQAARCVLNLAGRTPEDADLSQLVALLAELADAQAPDPKTMRLLTRLQAWGVWSAGTAFERIAERRAQKRRAICAAPTEQAQQEARASLADFRVLEARSEGRLTAVQPTGKQLDDLAYFYAAVSGSGPEVAHAEHDEQARALAQDDRANLTRRDLMRDRNRALWAGDLDLASQFGMQFLESLGHPGPLRLAENSDMRWGGSGTMFLMRELALHQELLGNYADAEQLYRRADNSGGMCGTSAGSYLASQIRGTIRTAEQQRGPCAAVAERLFAVAFDTKDLHGPQTLGDSTAQLARLYRGALLTKNRESAGRIASELSGAERDTRPVFERLRRVGEENWAGRVRALPGFADAAGASGLPELLAVFHREPGLRPEILSVLADQLRDHGNLCPQPDGSTWFGLRSWSSGGERSVESLMSNCMSRPQRPVISAVLSAAGVAARDRDPVQRERAAEVLGALALVSTKPLLTHLLADKHSTGGQTCTSVDGQQTCEEHAPVAQAAREALERISEVEQRRRDARATP